MQTFLPYADFSLSAECLDWRRLGKQRVESLQILRSLREGGGWSNHPAVKMWSGHEEWLVMYMNEMISEWVRRGYRNTMKIERVSEIGEPPEWLGDERLHSSHRSNLIRKDPEHYGKLGWTELPTMPYFWPSKG